MNEKQFAAMQDIRNIAIIAHVDHGKTTIVDRMIYQARQAREQEKLGELILDNNDLERERGITILAKNVSVIYKGVKINVIDTPGHSDFGGEVERVLNMADGVILLVDAFEGCMPQTRFVLQKAIEMGKKPVLVINKVDKLNCRPDEVQEEVFDLMFSLGATEDQLDFRTIYGSAKQGWMSYDWKQPTEDITALLDTILEVIPAPEMNEGTPQMLISSLEYSPYVGRIAVGRIKRGTLKANQPVTLCKRDGTFEKSRIKELMVFDGLGKIKVDEVHSGDICAVVGVEGFEIGDTIADYENPEALPPISVDEPTMSMLFCINDSPFFGREGKFVTSRHLKERLDKELENKQFAGMLRAGVSFEAAYQAMHHAEIVANSVAAAKAEAEKAVIDNLRAKGQRPDEAGASSTSAPLTGFDVRSLTREQRAEYARQAALGKRILFFLQCRLFNLHLDDLTGDCIQLCRHRVHLRADLGTGLIDQVNGLIR